MKVLFLIMISKTSERSQTAFGGTVGGRRSQKSDDIASGYLARNIGSLSNKQAHTRAARYVYNTHAHSNRRRRQPVARVNNAIAKYVHIIAGV